MKKAIYLIILILLSACASRQKAITTNVNADGSSFEKAIIITEVHERDGIDAEYKWIDQHYPNAKRNGQSLNYHDKVPYDLIRIITTDGQGKTIYFNIKNFFGKF